MHRFQKTASALLVVLFCTVGLTGCGSKYTEDMPGVWLWNIGGGTLTVTLNKDGTGSLSGPMGAQKTNWRIQKGNNFVFSHNGKDVGFLINSIENGTLKGKDPSSPTTPIVWTRKK